jgi:hypothetical protein
MKPIFYLIGSLVLITTGLYCSSTANIPQIWVAIACLFIGVIAVSFVRATASGGGRSDSINWHRSLLHGCIRFNRRPQV